MRNQPTVCLSIVEWLKGLDPCCFHQLVFFGCFLSILKIYLFITRIEKYRIQLHFPYFGLPETEDSGWFMRKSFLERSELELYKMSHLYRPVKLWGIECLLQILLMRSVVITESCFSLLFMFVGNSMYVSHISRLHHIS